MPQIKKTPCILNRGFFMLMLCGHYLKHRTKAVDQ